MGSNISGGLVILVPSEPRKKIKMYS
jgi:hypothetical protein